MRYDEASQIGSLSYGQAGADSSQGILASTNSTATKSDGTAVAEVDKNVNAMLELRAEIAALKSTVAAIRSKMTTFGSSPPLRQTAWR